MSFRREVTSDKLKQDLLNQIDAYYKIKEGDVACLLPATRWQSVFGYFSSSTKQIKQAKQFYEEVKGIAATADELFLKAYNALFSSQDAFALALKAALLDVLCTHRGILPTSIEECTKDVICNEIKAYAKTSSPHTCCFTEMKAEAYRIRAMQVLLYPDAEGIKKEIEALQGLASRIHDKML